MCVYTVYSWPTVCVYMQYTHGQLYVCISDILMANCMCVYAAYSWPTVCVYIQYTHGQLYVCIYSILMANCMCVYAVYSWPTVCVYMQYTHGQLYVYMCITLVFIYNVTRRSSETVHMIFSPISTSNPATKTRHRLDNMLNRKCDNAAYVLLI
jgi:general stress protein 26